MRFLHAIAELVLTIFINIRIYERIYYLKEWPCVARIIGPVCVLVITYRPLSYCILVHNFSNVVDA